MTETLDEYCKRTEQEKRELSQKIAQMECSTFQLEKVIADLKLHNTDLVRRVVRYQEKYEFSQKCIKQLEEEITRYKLCEKLDRWMGPATPTTPVSKKQAVTVDFERGTITFNRTGES